MIRDIIGGIADGIWIVLWSLVVVVVLAGGLVAWNAFHYPDPPAACRVLGGHWSLVYGWQCG